MGKMSSTYKHSTSKTSALLKSLTALLIAVLLPLFSVSQTVIMPTTGSGDTTMSYAEVYDDGGPYGNHSQICNASYTFHTINSIGRYRVEVQSNLTHPVGNARLNIYNGGISTSNLMCSFPTGTGGVYYSSGNSVTVNFTADDDMPTQGFKIILCEFDNDVASQPNMSYTDSTTLRVRWNGRFASTQWRVDWAIVCENVDLDTFFANPSNYTSDTLSTRELYIYNIPVGCWVVYRIYADPVTECSPTVSGNGPVYQAPFVCPCFGPANISIVELEDSLVVSWTSDTVPESWHLWTLYGEVDTMLAGTVNSITIPYDYPCSGSGLHIVNNCNYGCNVQYLALPSGGCQQTVGGIQIGAVTATSIEVFWNNVEDSASRYMLSMSPISYSGWMFEDTLAYGDTSYLFNGLAPLTQYDFQVRVLCSDGQLGCYPRSRVYTTLMDNCIDYSDPYNSPQVKYTFGSYANPTQYIGRSIGRHTVMTITTQRDFNTGGNLLCVPPGEQASFKLGDDNVGATGETVTYNYFVDSVDKDMLVLKYAVVMQNPNHTSQNQPRFTMEILDENGVLIDSTCCYADFVAGNSLGWNTVLGTNVIWKDWTTVGIDIARYHGQMIKIRFTTKDCADGGHFGYAYFTVHCDSKRIALVNLCESLDSVRLRAPAGFEYRWMRGDDPTVISTQNEIMVPADSSVYRCFATFIGKPECNFVVTSRAVLPYPKAAFNYSVDTCAQRIYLYNRSYVDIDSVYLPYVRQTVVDPVWIVNSDTLRGDTVSVDASTPVPYNITLFCSLSQSICTDSTSLQLNPAISHSLRIIGDTTACSGDTVRLSLAVAPFDEISFHWNNNSTDTLCSFIANADTTLFVVSTYKFCTDTIYHNIRTFNKNNDTVALVTCLTPIDTLGFNVDSSGIYTHYYTNRFGCDSLISLNLLIPPSYYDTVSAVTCNEPFINGEFSEDSTGTYTHIYSTVNGCDSIYHLQFYRHPLFADTTDAEILYGDTYTFHNTTYDATGQYQSVYIDRYGCDSTYALNLNVIHLWFPNAVTPNGDGYSDILEIVGLLGSTIFDTPKISVYDRWGRLIYHCENIKSLSDFWDPNKTDSPDGTYFYRFTVSTSNHQIQHNSPVEVVRTH